MAEQLKFSNEPKLREQMQKRGWTDEMIRVAMRTPGITATGKKGPAIRYVHPASGKSVIVDAATGEIFHVGDEGYRYD